MLFFASDLAFFVSGQILQVDGGRLMGEMEKFEIGSGALTAGILAMGAELCSLRDATGREFLWQAGPAWPRHAPNLFPIVGRLKDDVLRHDGKAYHLTQHGFARDRRFTWLAREKSSCRLALTDDAETRAIYPFAFRLILAYEVAGAGAPHPLHPRERPGAEILPASMGAHPASTGRPRPGNGEAGAWPPTISSSLISLMMLQSRLVFSAKTPNSINLPPRRSISTACTTAFGLPLASRTLSQPMPPGE